MKILKMAGITGGLLSTLAWATCAAAQTVLPDAPVPAGAASSPPPSSAATLPPDPEPAAGDPLYAPLALGPETVHQKFMDYAVITVGPRALFGPAFGAGIRMAKPNYSYPNDWHQGAAGYFRNYGNGLAEEASLHTARFATSALLHEDFRYVPSKSTHFLARTAHALAFTVVDRSDSGAPRLALSNFAGAAAAGYVGNLYLPPGFNDVTHADERMFSRLGGFAITNVTREFAPEIFHATQKLHLPFPRIPVPEWWGPRENSHP